MTSPDGPWSVVVDYGPRDGGGGERGVLVALATGRGADAVAALPEADREASLLSWLSDAFGDDVPPARLVRTMDWHAEPFSRGGYASRLALASDPVDGTPFRAFGRVHFAGTESADVWRSFMEGTVQAGERAANEVIAAG